MRLNDIADNPGAVKKRVRVGRGPGSGKGKTGGRGIKGQKSRSGVSIKAFEGGQMPLHRRLPKRGFNNVQFQDKIAIVNVGQLNKKFEDDATVDEKALRAAGLVSGRCDAIKILGQGDLEKKLKIVVDAVSASARAKVEKAGGSADTGA